MITNKLKLTFLLLISLLPIVLATWYFGVSVSSTDRITNNNGVLISPVLDLASLELLDSEGQSAYQTFEELTEGVDPDIYKPRPWQLLFMTAAKCELDCLERLYLLRQIHLRLGKTADRVQRALIITDQNAAAFSASALQLLLVQQPDLQILTGNPQILQQQLAPSANGQDPVAENYIYVADPLGNIMLYFTPENTPEQILKDIDQLLDHSSLG